MISTAHHAVTLFQLTVENRHGADWQDKLKPLDIATIAREVALGFAGKADNAESEGAGPAIWTFPDGSQVRTGHFGMNPANAGSASEIA